MRQAAALAVVAAAAVLANCSAKSPPEDPAPGWPERKRVPAVRFDGVRSVEPRDVGLPPGYEITAVATDLTFPTGVAFDELGVAHVVEAGYAFGDVWAEPRLVRIVAGEKTVVAKGQRNGPWNGAAYHDGKFFIAEGGQSKGGRLLQIGKGGEPKILANGLPSRGDHHTNGPALDADGVVYFGQGTATNAGVVGPDNYELGWLQRFPSVHDLPCRDVVLTGRNFHSPDVLGDGEIEPRVETGAFKPFGRPSHAGEVVAGRLPCNGAVMRLDPRGGELELVAWGFRNPFGLAFGPDGRLFATDYGYDERGSRPTLKTGDPLWEVRPGAWYGWPDFGGDAHAQAPADFVLARHPGKVPTPAATFGPQASPGGLDFSTSDFFGHVGEAFVALFGDRVPGAGKRPPAGFRIVRVDVNTGRVEDFAVNRRGPGPASKLGSGGLERPIAARFAPHGQALYVVDFGVVLLDEEEGPQPLRGTGVLWRITRAGA